MDRILISNRLGLKTLIAAALSLLLGIAVFRVTEAKLYHSLDRHHLDGVCQLQSKEEGVVRLRRYVEENGLLLEDVNKLQRWVEAERYVMLEMYVNDMLMYDSSGQQRTEQVASDANHLAWKINYPIPFANGVAQAVLYCYYEMEEYYLASVAAATTGGVAVILSLLLVVSRKTSYIKQLMRETQTIANGDLSHTISVKGRDELGDLARGLDQMRIALIERRDSEERAHLANQELITAISHDLRSPLTSLIGYLEILQKKKYKNAEERSRFLSNGCRKAYQIKDLSDKLFEYFLVYKDEAANLSMEEFDGLELLMQVLGDGILDLESSGFIVRYQPLEQRCQLYVNGDMLQRVFDNFFANIRKYADPVHAVEIGCCLQGKNVVLTFRNWVKTGEPPRGTQIGLKTCEKIIVCHQGTFSFEKEDDTFTVIISLPTRQGKGDMDTNKKVK